MLDYLYNDLTSLILDCYYQVFRSPSSRGLTEISLRKAMSIALRQRGLRVQQNVTITHRYQEHRIGHGQLDLVWKARWRWRSNAWRACANGTACG